MIKLLLICLLVLGTTTVFSLTPMQTLLKYTTPSDSSWGCVNFTPYVHGYNPDYGPHPPTSVIDELLDVIVTQTKFKCIQTYGVLHNLTHTFEAAKIRGLKVVMVIWLEPFPANNTESIDIGIKMAKKYKDTIVGVSCGSEMRVRNALAIANPPVLECMQQVKAAGVVQPMTSNDYYWFWCDAQRPCKQWEAVVNLVDYVGINAFPWWENQHAPACVPAEEAPEMHLAMYKEVVATYPTKTVIITEFGWPGGPDGATEINDFTNKPCTGVASESNQTYVLEKSIELLQKNKVPGITFCAFRETWKTGHEGEIASYWGFCDNTPPYKCKKLFGYEGTGGEQQESNEVSSSDEEPQNRTSAASAPTLSSMVLIGTIVYLISFMSAPKLSLLHQSFI